MSCKTPNRPEVWGPVAERCRPAGSHRNKHLGNYYFIEVAKTTQVYLGPLQVLPADLGPLGPRRKYPRVAPGTPPPAQVGQVASLLPEQAWELQPLHEGSKGPIQARIACIRVTRC